MQFQITRNTIVFGYIIMCGFCMFGKISLPYSFVVALVSQNYCALFDIILENALFYLVALIPVLVHSFMFRLLMYVHIALSCSLIITLTAAVAQFFMLGLLM